MLSLLRETTAIEEAARQAEQFDWSWGHGVLFLSIVLLTWLLAGVGEWWRQRQVDKRGNVPQPPWD